ncbi:MAG TPA: hypothetical protein VNC15_07065 [Solirubrobacterales bacterium]|nr:hypothetical protein [Solirubrobacterales bacterium]
MTESVRGRRKADPFRDEAGADEAPRPEAGVAVLNIKPKPTTKKALETNGTVKVRVKVTFKPAGGKGKTKGPHGQADPALAEYSFIRIFV